MQIGNCVYGAFKHVNNNRMIGGMMMTGVFTMTWRYIMVPFEEIIAFIGCWTTLIVTTSIFYLFMAAPFDTDARKVLLENFWTPLVTAYNDITNRAGILIAAQYAAQQAAAAPQAAVAPAMRQRVAPQARARSPAGRGGRGRAR